MTSADVAKKYFEAIAAFDLDAATAMWAPGGVERLVGQRELTAPDGVRELQQELRGAFPDLRWEVLDVIGSNDADADRVAVRWRATGTFAGPGSFQGFVANGAHLEMEGCDVLTINPDGKIETLDAYLDSGDVARQLGVLPPAGSRAEMNLTKLANARTKARGWIHSSDPERIAEGVWLLRGGIPRIMNVYLIEDEGGVTVFDAGSSDMAAPLAAAAARLGGITRIVLGHADADHRGAAPALAAPVFCHEAERAAAASPEHYRDYWDRSQLDARGRSVLWRLLLPTWDGGPLQIAGTLDEGDHVAGFDVVHLPGHAPGLIGLFRPSDRLALVSDAIYTLDIHGRKEPAHVPHPAFNHDTEQARASIRKLAELQPASVWAGHADPVTGDVRAQLERAATA